jgi:hypothetical protein
MSKTQKVNVREQTQNDLVNLVRKPLSIQLEQSESKILKKLNHIQELVEISAGGIKEHDTNSRARARSQQVNAQ